MSELKVEAVETGQGTDRKANVTYTLEECVDSYGQSCVPVCPSSDESEAGTLHKALPYAQYASLRIAHFCIEAVILVIGTAALAIVCMAIAEILTGKVTWYAAYIMCFLISPFLLKYADSTNTKISNIFGLRVVDKNGSPLSKKLAIIRAAVYSVSWFVLPLHFLFLAAESRRFLHDYASGAYVMVGEREHPRTSFYPRASLWTALVLAGFGLMFYQFKFVDLPPAFQKVGADCVAQIFGTESQLALELMEWQYSSQSIDYANLSKDEARQYISIYSRLLALRTKYYGRNDSQAGLYRLSLWMLENRVNQYE